MSSAILGIKKSVVLLDTNFISNLAKAQRGSIPDPDGGLHHLYSLLFSRSSTNKVICPYGVFHDIESELTHAHKRAIRDTISMLSGGVHWHHWDTIRERQVTRALYAYLDTQNGARSMDWREAFQRNPDEPYEIALIRAEFPVSSKSRAALRAAKLEYAQAMGALPIRQETSRFEDFLASEFNGAAASYLQPIAHLSNMSESGNTPAIVEATRRARPAMRLYQWYLRITGAKPDPFALDSAFLGFFTSEHFKSAPQIEILAALHAGLRFYFPDRIPKPGDSYDLRTVSAFLPYCDIMATDTFVKDLINRLALDEKYGVSVYSARRPDAEDLCRQLSLL